jgi:adhesin transport system outer membrane protein
MQADAPVIQMERVLFKGSTDDLDPKSFKELDRIFNFLNTHQDLKFEVVCYVHDTEKDSLTSHMLAMRRARNVKKYLVKKGIDYNRLIVRGYVNTQPVRNNKGKIDLNLSNRSELQRVK